MDNSKASHSPDRLGFNAFFSRLSEEELLSSLSIARNNAKEGQTADAKEAVSEIREKYGLSS